MTSPSTGSPSASNPSANAHTAQPPVRLGCFEGHEEVAIPVRWPGMAVLSLFATLPVWIIAASLKFLAPALVSGRVAVLLVLGGWTAVFLVAALLQLLWWLGGAERIAVIGQDLLVRHTMFGLPVTTRSFRGCDIRQLGATGMREEGWLREPWPPFLSSSRIGGVKFSYREALIYLGHDLEEAAAAEIVTWLAQRLPPETAPAELGRPRQSAIST